jgi:beta-lactamase class A
VLALPYSILPFEIQTKMTISQYPHLPSHPKFRPYLIWSFLIGILVAFVFFKLFQCIIPNQGILQSNEKCDYSVSRVDGYQLVKPLLSVEPECESKRFAGLRSNLHHLVDSLQSAGCLAQASVYLREFDHGEWMSVNGDVAYHPASLTKTALLLACLRLAETYPGMLTQKVRYDPPDSVQINPQYFQGESIRPGQTYTVHELLYYMIAHSDNHAAWVVASRIDAATLRKMFSDLGLQEPHLDDLQFKMTAKECSTFLKAIYNVAYLSPEYSDYAARLLSECQFKKGFVRGLPQGTKLWHKFGEWNAPQHLNELHESGVIYLREKPYLLTVMTKGKNNDQLAESISKITEETAEGVLAAP